MAFLGWSPSTRDLGEARPQALASKFVLVELLFQLAQHMSDCCHMTYSPTQTVLNTPFDPICTCVRLAGDFSDLG